MSSPRHKSPRASPRASPRHADEEHEEHEVEHAGVEAHHDDDDEHQDEHYPGDPIVVRGKWWNPLWRSQPMSYVNVTMGTEPAPDIIRQLGIFGKFHIEDLSSREAPVPEFTKYKRKSKELETLEKRMEVIENKLPEYQIEIPDRMDHPGDKVGDVTVQISNFVTRIESELEPNETFYANTKTALRSLETCVLALRTCERWESPSAAGKSLRAKLRAERGRDIEEDDEELGLRERKASPSVSTSRSGEGKSEEKKDDADEARTEDGRMREDVVGVLPSSLYPAFNRMLFRATRGNAFMRHEDHVWKSAKINDDEEEVSNTSTVFMVVVVGKGLAARVRRIARSFGAEIYVTPTDKSGYRSAIETLDTQITDQLSALRKTRATIVSLLTAAAGDSHDSPLRMWQAHAVEERSVAEALTKCQFYLTMIGVEGWVPTVYLGQMRNYVKRATAGTGHPPAVVECNPRNPIKQPKPVNPPTFFETNKYTETFQSIVDTYGVPRYQEINPGLFTCITFPFLFGVMYGDIGHGSLLTIASFFIIFYEKRIYELVKKGQFLGDVGSMAYQGRYCLILMGLFAVYNGTIYNECMSVPLAIYKTGYSDSYIINNVTEQFYPNGGVYQYGVDYRWYHAENQLAFMNSFKMKTAVTLGVIHMTFGIVLSLFNHIYFKDKPSIYLEFIPRLIFMMFTFGYMILMIWIKWIIDWNYPGARPPNLIQVMIAMFLQPGTVDEDHTLYSGQAGIQTFLVLIAVICVPIMLFGKPCWKHKCKQFHTRHEFQDDGDDHHDPHEHKTGGVLDMEGGGPKDAPHAEGGAHEEHTFGDDMIHSGIHTIEFVLGAVSNTASYLRLWALSLAHSELADVFWEKMLAQYGYDAGSPIMTFVGFAVWAAATFGVLLLMDVLECFLHALRLHWVEFQGKFYYADGYAFDPFAFDYFPPIKK